MNVKNCSLYKNVNGDFVSNTSKTVQILKSDITYHHIA